MPSKEEKIVIDLANSFSDSSEFINHIEKLFPYNYVNISDKAFDFERVGSILFQYSFFKHALFLWHHALQIYINVSDRLGCGRCFINLGNAYNNLGDYRKAIEYYEKSLSIAKGMEDLFKFFGEPVDRQSEGVCYASLGNAYNNLGDYRKAIEYYEKSLSIAKEMEDLLNSLGEPVDRQNEGRYYINLGSAYNNLGDYRKAIEYYEKSLSNFIKIDDKWCEGRCYTNLGYAYHNLGEIRKAIEYQEKGLDMAKEIGDKQGEGGCYAGLAYLGLGDNKNLSLGDNKKAIEYYEKSLSIVKEIGDKQIEIKCYLGLAQCYDNLRDYTNTCDYLEKSIDIQEKIGHDLIEEEHKLVYYGLQVNVYYVNINIFILAKQTDKAFEYLEKSKSKTFNEILSMTGHQIPSVKNIGKEYQSLLDEEERLIARLKAIQIQSKQRLQQLNSPTTTTPIQLNSLESDDLINQLSLVYDKIEKEFDPEYVFVRRSKSFPVSNIQDILKSIKKYKNKNAVIVEYYIDGIGNKIHIFVVSSDRIDIESVDIKDFNLDNKIDLYLKEISSAPPTTTINNNNNTNHNNNNANKYLQYSKELSHYLIEPISSYLSNVDLIYFVPFGKIHYLPLHALLLDNKPLIVDHAVAYIPSASLLKFVKNKGTGSIKNCLSCGIVFKEEAKEIANIFSSSGSNSSVYMEEPTKKEFIDKITSTIKNVNNSNNSYFDILHLSCHGRFNSKDPMSSALLFPGEFLRAREILDLQLNTELVTLSACETGRNENKPGEELVGLTRSFLYAGTPSVLVSLWKVHSETTREIMIEFYKQLKSGGSKTKTTTDLATALQTAQKNIMQKSEHKHPYFWAPFVLVGDWE